MSNYGGYFTCIQRDSSLNENHPTTLAKTGINLTSLLRQNLLEEDSIEDLHFYFVSFQQHKKQILALQKTKAEEIKKRAVSKGKQGNSSYSVAANSKLTAAKKLTQLSNRMKAFEENKQAISSAAGSPTNGDAMSGDLNSTANCKTIESCDDDEFL